MSETENEVEMPAAEEATEMEAQASETAEEVSEMDDEAEDGAEA